MTQQPDRAPSSSVLDDALARVRELDPALAATLTREVDSLREGRKFGLVFNRHLPESVRLPNHPVKRGVKVALRNTHAAAKNEKDATWRVTRVAKAESGERVAWLAGVDTPRLVSDLVVVREFGEPVYPGLRSVERIERGKPSDPTHLVINGENHHALQALRMTHRSKVDLIYIDPPYNTGNQGWIYNDRYVDVAKGDASSKWLSFMERRLLIARELLKDTGVIIVAIGDDEHHRLRMLMDQVFGPQNFLSNITWQGRGSYVANHHAGGVDYMLMYGKHYDRVPRLLDPKPAAPGMLRCVAEALEGGASAAEAQEVLRRHIKSAKVTGGLAGYNHVDPQGRIYCKAPIAQTTYYRPNLVYDVTDPDTGRVYPGPRLGWTHSQAAMSELIKSGRVHFGTNSLAKKQFLSDYMSEMPLPTFMAERSRGTKHLDGILGDRKRFPNPKDHEVLMRWFRMAAPKDAVILDFFGGSGSTTEAVLRLNAEDGGTRQSILVTNNELSAADAKRLGKDGFNPGDPEWEARGVFEYVTRPRIGTVVTGKRPDGSTYSDGLEANVEFFDLTYLDESRVSRAKEFAATAPLLWMQAGAVGERIDAESPDGFAVTSPAGAAGGGYAVLFDEDATSRFIKAMAGLALQGKAPAHVFVVTDSPSHFEHVTGRLPAGVTATQLYGSYLRNFEINVEGQ